MWVVLMRVHHLLQLFTQRGKRKNGFRPQCFLSVIRCLLECVGTLDRRRNIGFGLFDTFRNGNFTGTSVECSMRARSTYLEMVWGVVITREIARKQIWEVSMRLPSDQFLILKEKHEFLSYSGATFMIWFWCAQKYRDRFEKTRFVLLRVK